MDTFALRKCEHICLSASDDFRWRFGADACASVRRRVQRGGGVSSFWCTINGADADALAGAKDAQDLFNIDKPAPPFELLVWTRSSGEKSFGVRGAVLERAGEWEREGEEMQVEMVDRVERRYVKSESLICFLDALLPQDLLTGGFHPLDETDIAGGQGLDVIDMPLWDGEQVDSTCRRSVVEDDHFGVLVHDPEPF